MKCQICSYDDHGTGDGAHHCRKGSGPVIALPAPAVARPDLPATQVWVAAEQARLDAVGALNSAVESGEAHEWPGPDTSAKAFAESTVTNIAYHAKFSMFDELKSFFSQTMSQAPDIVSLLDYGLLKLTLGQTQERLRQIEEAIEKRDVTALRVAQCAGEFARDANRQALDAARWRFVRNLGSSEPSEVAAMESAADEFEDDEEETPENFTKCVDLAMQIMRAKNEN